MKHLLRKLFFWDEPAKGAFFGLTLLIILPRLLLTLGFGALLPLFFGSGALLPQFLRGEDLQAMYLNSLMILGVVVVAALLYALLQFCHLLPKINFCRCKVLVVALCACAILMIVFFAYVPSEYERLWGIFPIVLIVFSVIYVLHPTVTICDWLLAVVPLIVGLVFLFLHFKKDTAEASVALLLQNQPAGATSSAWMAWPLGIGAIAFLVLSYLLQGRIIAKIGGVSLRNLFGRGVAVLWILFAIAYLASVGMALNALRDYSNAKKELDSFWGMPVNVQAITERYRASGRIDQAFWNELCSLKVQFTELEQQYDGIGLGLGYQNAVFPPDIHEQWRKAFTESPELLRREEMLDEPPPLPERTFFPFDNHYLYISCDCIQMTREELWRVRLALEANDILSAQKALRRIDNVVSILPYDYDMISGLVWMAVEQMRPLALSWILASGLVDEPWLHEQDALLQDIESRVPAAQQRYIQGETAYMMNIIDELVKHTSWSWFLTFPERWQFLGREGASFARCGCIHDFADYPEKPSGILTGMQARNLRSIGKRITELIAALRISRGMIAAELARRTNGCYPDTLENLPTDPFSDQPLKYAIGTVEITEDRFQPNKNPASPEILQQVWQQMGLTEAQAEELKLNCPTKYVFQTDRRTVDAVKIWSVGPDGIDDGGITRKPEFGSSEKEKDDIRFIIPIP